jgi:DNA ligase-1
MSEKLDGVRAYWDGEAFVSRLGNRFYAPDWFVADLPANTLDGELWVGRKQFSRTISIVRSGAGGQEWKEVQFVVFDAPNAKGGFEERLAHVEKVLGRAESRYARALDHVVCEGLEHLREELARVEQLGGEGLMLRRPKSPYEIGRSLSLLKVKTFHDAEGRIVKHVPGTGKHKGRLGSVVCELPSGLTFNIGTGFSDAERKDPPPIGSVVTFRYQELTDDGVPRFPSWVGVRIDAEWPPRSEARPVKQVSGQAKAAKAAPVASVAPAVAAAPVVAAAKPAAGKKEATTAAAAAAPAAATPAAPAAPAAAAAAAPAAAAAAAAAPAAAAPAAAAAKKPAKEADGLTISLVHPEGKFWEIEVRGGSHYTRFGKVGTAGQTRVAELGSAAAARDDAEKRAQQKRKEGYVAR